MIGLFRRISIVVKKIMCIVGARPNFMKFAPLFRELSKFSDEFKPILVHTGQHYDQNLSKLFFDDLEIPDPDFCLGVGSGSHAEQTARVLVEMEKVLQGSPPDLLVVFGDVNSTMAAAISAAKLDIPIAHVEAGLRSFDRSMPEEINRIVTDHLSSYLFVSEKSGVENLMREGIPSESVFFTGNIMIDSLRCSIEAAKNSTVLDTLSLASSNYALMTLHRPSSVDHKDTLSRILSAVEKISGTVPVVFPCHPRTRRRIEEFGMARLLTTSSLKIIDPLGHIDFCKLLMRAEFVLTDSGGIQEETTFLQIPCLTIRANTERPVTVDVGTNVLCGTDTVTIAREVQAIFEGKAKSGSVPELWDGRTAARIVEIMRRAL